MGPRFKRSATTGDGKNIRQGSQENLGAGCCEVNGQLKESGEYYTLESSVPSETKNNKNN
jgi:hypothetical protein